MPQPKILVQLDPDAHASVFDAVVAIDSEIDQLLQYNHVEPDQVRDLVHGTIFTRGVRDLRNTAIFVGGSNVQKAEVLVQRVTETFFGPMRVSVMMDADGANTTAAAAVVAAARHVDLTGLTSLVLAATGPVGQRVVRLLAGAGGEVRVASRKLDRASAVCDSVRQAMEGAGSTVSLTPLATSSPAELATAVEGADVVIAAGASGIELLPADVRRAASSLRVAIDLNAVPPLGITGIDVMDKAVEHDGAHCYGAVGVGGTKMKIHKEAIRRLFKSNDLVLEAEQIFAIARELESA